MIKSLYLIGSLRNREIVHLENTLRKTGFDPYASWMAAGPEADDYWQEYCTIRGLSYREALRDYSAQNVFEFDHTHLERCDAAVLVMPAGKSAHIEMGFTVGRGKPAWVLFDHGTMKGKLSEEWYWVAGIYEGEGAFSINNTTSSGANFQIQLTSTDKETIDKLYRITGVGRVQGPYKEKGGNLIKKPENPKDKYRWAVYKRDDIFYVLNGIWSQLGERRKSQILGKLKRNNMSEKDFLDEKGPREFRFDVMYNFATDVCFSEPELIKSLNFYNESHGLTR